MKGISLPILDFDKIDTWYPKIHSIAQCLFSQRDIEEASRMDFEYIEDAADYFASKLSYSEITNILIEKLSDCEVRFFHGTRLTPEDAKRIHEIGLTPLLTSERYERLAAIFSKHERWMQVSHRLKPILEELGPKELAGVREDGCVHACLSRVGLLRGCNHYIEFGAEVDQHAAHRLFGDNSGYQLLKSERQPALIQFTKPFSDAIGAMNPFGLPDDCFSSLPGTFFTSWAFRLSDASYEPSQLRSGAAARFKGAILANQIEKFEWISDNDLSSES
jgi:hypothetical protein